MSAILKVRMPDGTVVGIPAIVGPPGKDGKTYAEEEAARVKEEAERVAAEDKRVEAERKRAEAESARENKEIGYVARAEAAAARAEAVAEAVNVYFVVDVSESGKTIADLVAGLGAGEVVTVEAYSLNHWLVINGEGHHIAEDECREIMGEVLSKKRTLSMYVRTAWNDITDQIPLTLTSLSYGGLNYSAVGYDHQHGVQVTITNATADMGANIVFSKPAVETQMDTERWTFELSDGTLVEKDVVVG